MNNILSNFFNKKTLKTIPRMVNVGKFRVTFNFYNGDLKVVTHLGYVINDYYYCHAKYVRDGLKKKYCKNNKIEIDENILVDTKEIKNIQFSNIEDYFCNVEKD
jgi:hypothetical protein